MTHDELLAKIDEEGEFLVQYFDSKPIVHSALRAVVELHKPITPNILYCSECRPRYNGDPEIVLYPCPTIQAIEKELA